MPNYLWYLVLVIISVLIFMLTLQKTKDLKLIPFILAISGVIYILEYVVLILFEAYQYYPKLLSNDYYDNILGAIVSNAFAIPITATFVAAFQVGWGWQLVIVGAFIGIEMLFLTLGIYQHYWWHTYYTFIALVSCFTIVKRWYCSIEHKKRFTLALTLFFISNTLLNNGIYIANVLFNIPLYEINWFTNPSRDNTAFFSFINFFIAIPFTFLVYNRLSVRKHLLAVTLLLVANWLLITINILQPPHSWSLVAITFIYTATLTALHWLKGLLDS